MEISKHFRYVISRTFDLVAEYQHEMITPEHILLVVLRDNNDSELLKAYPPTTDKLFFKIYCLS